MEAKKKLTPEQMMLDSLYLTAGTKVSLIDYGVNEESGLPAGTILEGILDSNIQIGQSIQLDKKSKKTGRIIGAQYDGGRIFLKTDTSIYELIPPDKTQDKSVESPEVKKIEKNLRILLKKAQLNAIDWEELVNLWEEKSLLKNQNMTKANNSAIKKINKELDKHKITVSTTSEYKILLELLNRNHYWTTGTVAHENAHANKSEKLNVPHLGYSIIVYKDRGQIAYEAMSQSEAPQEWDEKKKIEARIKIANAPKEYSSKLSPGDEEKIKQLKEQLKNL